MHHWVLGKSKESFHFLGAWGISVTKMLSAFGSLESILVVTLLTSCKICRVMMSWSEMWYCWILSFNRQWGKVDCQVSLEVGERVISFLSLLAISVHVYYLNYYGCRLCRQEWDPITFSNWWAWMCQHRTQLELKNSNEAIHKPKLRCKCPSWAKLCKARVHEMVVWKLT